MELLRKKRAEASRRIAKIGWAAVGGLALITAVVLLVVMKKQEARRDKIQAEEEGFDWHPVPIPTGHVEDPRRGGRFGLPRSRALRESLDGIEAKLTGTADLTVLGDLLTTVRDVDLQMQAADAGGEWKTRHEELRLRVTERYIESLRGACRSAATATSGEGLAPFGTLEDLLRTVVIEARAANDLDATRKYEPMLMQIYGEINAICSKLFDDDYQNKVAWTDLLTDPSAWSAIPSSFKCKFGPLTMSNPAGDSAQSCGINYFPAGHNWRDYVLDMEFKLDSGVMVFYTRVGEKMDTKDAPCFSVGGGTGGRQVQVVVDYGKTNTMTVSTIGNQMTVKLNDQIVFGPDDIKGAKSRKGEPGIVVQAGPALATELTITRLRARLLR